MSDPVSARIGRQRTDTDVLSERLVASFVATLDPFLASSDPGQAPLCAHWCLVPPLTRTVDLKADGHPPLDDFLPPCDLPRRMWAGGEIEFGQPLAVGETVERRSTFDSISEKEGKSGRLRFVAMRHELAGASGGYVTERQDIVYLPASRPEAAPRADLGEAADCDLAWEVEATTSLLFRYSALTFNSHRIHYDLPYACNEEGLPGLLVHGPLQATLLANLAAALAQGRPKRFVYRAVSPLVAGGIFRAKARREGSDIACWTESGTGTVTMTGKAFW
ncbi:MaoC family dehydratase N-terminal domain-containing protein (plasmid) [Aminobacter sp. SR38]|jgi:3-methylfumaryl-CoA hydratase|uniref:FAS1-like dehydratase domain-containing protein n=1 Tax=Aminobacter sp. SR38 TaxID=2774562 RepID=UPI00178528A1|nr:MaoC family dehydratase N-terminal domain-containing protein [Aminobacter sp. SR38]QOF75059.1 MaoC family dehydratase N-terminal domain-containing protein [Aminobacter sp. SR38]